MKVPLRDGIFWWWNLWNFLCGMFSLVEEFVEYYLEGQRVVKENEWFLNHS